MKESCDDEYSIWSYFGLASNPFSPDPLPAFGGELSIDSFYGRESELKQINMIINNNPQSRILVNGNIGLGKTTFVNFVRAKAFQRGYFTTLAEIGIQYDWDAEAFMGVTLSAIYTSITRIKGIREKFDSNFLKKLDIYFGSYRGSSVGGNIGTAVVSIGGSKGDSYSVPALNSFVMKDLLVEIVENLKKAGYKGLIIHYNNLELLHGVGDRNIVKLFNGIRDFLQVDGVHFIFVGDSTVPEILQKVPRVDEIFHGPPILISPFGLEDITKILDKRVDQLKIGSLFSYEKPYSPDAIQILYELFNGNIRAIFKSLTTAMIAVSTSGKLAVLHQPNLAKTLRKIAEERYLNNLNSTDQRILAQILNKKETTNKLIAETLKLKPQNVSASITKLRENNAIRLSRVEGRARYYVPSPEIKWLLFKVTTDNQAMLTDFIV